MSCSCTQYPVEDVPSALVYDALVVLSRAVAGDPMAQVSVM